MMIQITQSIYSIVPDIIMIATQNLITWSFYYPKPLHKLLLQSINAAWVNVANKQTTENIISLAEIIKLT